MVMPRERMKLRMAYLSTSEKTVDDNTFQQVDC
jgi:hypothetical protein